MEALEEPPFVHDVTEVTKITTSNELIATDAGESVETDVCHTSNGVLESNTADSKDEEEAAPVLAVESAEPEVTTETLSKPEEMIDAETSSAVSAALEPEPSNDDSENGPPVDPNEETLNNEFVEIEESQCINEDVPVVQESLEDNVVEEAVVEVDGIVDNGSGNVNITFETEIFIENTAELDEHLQSVTCEEPDTNNILSELGQNIELSDVLRSSDVLGTIENNNCEQEVFNKEELLDILEGNDVKQSRKIISEKFNADSKKLEEHLAIQQLNRLKCSESKRNKRKSPKKVEKRTSKRHSSSIAAKELKEDETPKKESNVIKEAKPKEDTSKKEGNASKVVKVKVDESIDHKEKVAKVDERSKNGGMGTKVAKVDETPIEINASIVDAKVDDAQNKECIVTALVRDWEDDEHVENDESIPLVYETEAILEESTDELVKSQEAVIEDTLDDSQVDAEETLAAETSTSEEMTGTNKAGDDSQPQRRLGRVIKKKVIFDPDNPDTFTKSKVHVKKERDSSNDKDQSTPKKMKVDHPAQIPKAKSPVSKMQWKKPPPKPNNNKNKRASEIDKLLMDEGAVNMICQLTPEAPKGKKNTKSKAEFIKSIQSNTPDSKEMKFRERKSKPVKTEDGEVVKVGSAKHRLSLSSSVKSPTVSEDFEAHSADDSIIYRRHSSSSYSDSCMSPRRLSDVEGTIQIPVPASKITESECHEVTIIETNDSDIFMGNKASTPNTSEIMNKSDCLSIKEKLNNKLSQALNKRKRDSIKVEKPPKVKKVLQVDEISTDVTVNFNQRVAEICIGKAGSMFSIQIMKVLVNILSMVDSNSNIAITLITSECGTLCSGMDLKPILENVKHAHEIADQARLLLCALERHSKILLIGVEGRSQGFSVALAALSDVLLASENATFSLSDRNSVVCPGAAVLTSKALPQHLVNNLVVFGRELSAYEALEGGLVSRVIWPDRFQDQVRAIARDLAAQPFENIMLKKQLIGLKKVGSASTFQVSLEKERDLIVKYWTSDEGRALVGASLDVA